MTAHLKVLLHEDGPALWPDYIDTAALEGARRESGTPVFNTMYQAEPGGLRGQIISRDYFRYIADGAIERAFIAESRTYMTIDPAISERSSADETAIVVGSMHPNNMCYLRFVWHGRISFGDQERIIVEAARRYQPVAIGIEKVAYQTALIQMLEDRHHELPIESIPVERDKWSRHLDLAADYEFGRVLHHMSLQNSAYENQLVHLGTGKHDDMADAAAMLTATYVDGGSATAGERPKGFR